MHFQPQDSYLEGLSTNMKYQANGVTQQMFDSKPDGDGAITYTYINRFHIVGNGVQYYVKRTVHLTVNANGMISSDVSSFSAECK